MTTSGTISSDVWVATLSHIPSWWRWNFAQQYFPRLIHNYFHVFSFCQSTLPASAPLLLLHTQYWAVLYSFSYLRSYHHIGYDPPWILLTLIFTIGIFRGWDWILVEAPKNSWDDVVPRDALHGIAWQHIGHYLWFHRVVDYGKWNNQVESSNIGFWKFITEVRFSLSEELIWYLNLMKLQDI